MESAFEKWKKEWTNKHMRWPASHEAWDAALEEAAKIAESFNDGDEAVMAFPSGIARAIRRELKEQK